METQESFEPTESFEEKTEEPIWPGDKKKDFHEYQTEETFTFSLNEAEKADKANRLVDVENQIAEKDKHLKQLQKDIKKEIKELEALKYSYLRAIEDGEDRFIPCLKRVYGEKNVVEFLTLDGKEVLKERALEPGDRQLKMVDSNAMVEHSSEQEEIDYNANHQKAKEAEEAALDDAGEELEKITDKTLRDNTPSF